MLQLRVSGSQKEDYKQTTKVTSITPCSNAHRTADGVMLSTATKEPEATKEELKVVEGVTAEAGKGDKHHTLQQCSPHR